jgi:serine/threonine-protein kinase
VAKDAREERIEVPGVVLGQRRNVSWRGNVFDADKAGTPCRVTVLKLPAGHADEARFRRELDMAAALAHPHLLRVLGSGRTGSSLWIVEESAPGGSLAKRLGAAMPVAEAVRVTADVARALAHAAGRAPPILLEPDALLFAADGRVKVSVPNPARFARDDLELRWAGFYSPGADGLAYYPPEELDDAARADERSAVYRLGALLYHMLAGKKPFVAKTNMQFFMKLLNEPPPPIERPELSPALAGVVGRCLAKKPGDRFQTINELVLALG